MSAIQWLPKQKKQEWAFAKQHLKNPDGSLAPGCCWRCSLPTTQSNETEKGKIGCFSLIENLLSAQSVVGRNSNTGL